MKILRQMSRFIYLWSLSLSFGTDVVVSTSVVRCDATAVLNKRREILFLDRPIWIIFQFHAKVAIGMDENNVFFSRRIFWDSFQWKLCVGSVCDVNYEWCFKWQFLKGGPAATNLRWNLWNFFCTLCQLNDEWDMFLNMGCSFYRISRTFHEYMRFLVARTFVFTNVQHFCPGSIWYANLVVLTTCRVFFWRHLRKWKFSDCIWSACTYTKYLKM